MHTNATVVPNGQSAMLTIDGKMMQVSLLNAPSGASFSKSAAVRLSSDPTPPEADQSNDGVDVLIVIREHTFECSSSETAVNCF
jgi:hypothetical protein